MYKYYGILTGLLESAKEKGSSTKVLSGNNVKQNSDLDPVVPPVSVLFPLFVYTYNRDHNTCSLLRNCSINGADTTTISMSRSAKSADIKKGSTYSKQLRRGRVGML